MAKSDLRLLVEPSYYQSQQKLLGEMYIWYLGIDIPYFEELKKEFMTLKVFNEFALNIGLQYRYRITENLNTYILGSVGPMYSGVRTERLAKGFAFSDILALGVSYKLKRILWDLRLSLRHNSNLNLSHPNAGHNSTCFGAGIAYQLQ
ncbi:MAG: acyloxyacyl hydrolase [Flavobacteriales bacterium]|nr:acyloxyacyl hydrolase [Flavobacteriales bacterium]